jgi:hopanoid biosynthesis associated protein HpnK
VNADDFGRSPGINDAVDQAHRHGILTTASLMVAGDACAGAVALARARPRLGVGLHLTLACGRAALPPERVPGLAGADGRFRRGPVAAGLAYFFDRRLAAQIAAETEAQLACFRATGLPLDHVNGHLNLHLHPAVLDVLLPRLPAGTPVRLTHDPFWLNARLAGGAWGARAAHALVFRGLCAAARRKLRRHGVPHARHVFGLLQNGRITAAYVTALAARLPPGDSELYAHPSTTACRHELDALTSPAVRAALAGAGVQLIRHRDLAA